MRHLKEKCAGCEKTEFNVTKEHLFPEWLILRTNTHNTSVRWLDKRIPALSVTIPLCSECNKIYGEKLESPVAHIFDDLEAGLGISDFEADLLVRWMWKFQGLNWHINHPEGIYSAKYTLTERLTNRIDDPRSRITIAISLLENINPVHGDLPMGVDSVSRLICNHISGVFSRLAIIISYTSLIDIIPDNYSLYTLADRINKKKKTKVFFPKTGFKSDDDAVSITKDVGKSLAYDHDKYALDLLQTR